MDDGSHFSSKYFVHKVGVSWSLFAFIALTAHQMNTAVVKDPRYVCSAPPVRLLRKLAYVVIKFFIATEITPRRRVDSSDIAALWLELL